MSGIIDCEMHIGDEVFVHGYIDEIRNDTIIIRNVGGYFGTSRDEVFYYEDDGYGTMKEADRKTEPQTETQTETQNSNLTFEKRTMRDCYNCIRYETEGECVECKFEPKDEPQTDTEIAKAIVHKMIDDAVIAEDAYPDLRQRMHEAVNEYEPQTDCPWK